MKRILPAFLGLLLLGLLIKQASAQTTGPMGDSQDFGNRIRHASNASVNSQFLAFPLPMTNWKKGHWQVGVGGGFSDIDASVIKLDGPLGSVGYSHSFADGWGVYGLAFFNDLSMGGGGQTDFLTPFNNNIPIAVGSSGHTQVNYTNVTGSVKETGFGGAIVWDPRAKRDDDTSMPIYLGVIINKLKITNSSADFTILDGADAGQTGKQIMDGDYSFMMPFFGIQYSRNLGENWKMIPSLFLSMSGEEPQHGRVIGISPKVFDLSGSTSGDDEAGFKIEVLAPGFTFVYRPWGLGINVGATIFKAAFAATIFDGIESVLTFNATWRFGNYIR